MIAALIQGSLFRSPVKSTSKTGTPFVSATLRTDNGEGWQFVRVVAFSENPRAELMRLCDGEVIAVQGPLKAGIFTGAGGVARVSLSIIANSVLSIRG
jgi:Single-strand binding protein family